jgi:hypothetical protein
VQDNTDGGSAEAASSPLYPVSRQGMLCSIEQERRRMDKITIKTPNPKGRLFLKNVPVKGFGGRCLSV